MDSCRSIWVAVVRRFGEAFSTELNETTRFHGWPWRRSGAFPSVRSIEE